MDRLLVVLALVLGIQLTAAAQAPAKPAVKSGAAQGMSAEKAAVMAPIHQFADGFNKGDVTSALGACAEETYIIDEFAPYQWKACAKWASDFDADAKKNGITDGAVTLGTPKHVDIAGDRAYVVVPTTYSFKQNGKPMKETGSTLTITLLLFRKPECAGPVGRRHIGKDQDKHEGKDDDERQALDSRGENRLNLSTRRSVQQGCRHDRAHFGVEESFPKRTGLGHAHADVFH